MTKSLFTRRNFLSSMAILSAGTAFTAPLKHFSPVTNDLQKNWKAFWKRSGGRIAANLAGINTDNGLEQTKGHYYIHGELIYFPKENIIAQPTWIFWENDRTKPADVIVTLFENDPLKRIIRYNRHEMDALYCLSKEPGSHQLLLAPFNNCKTVKEWPTGRISTKTRIKKYSQIQDISYYKGQVLVFEDRFFHNT